MKTIARQLLVAASLLGALHAASAANFVVNPSSDGSLYVCDGCNIVSDGDYVLVSGYIQGAVKFPTADFAGATKVKSAQLSVNPYGLPLWDLTVDVYGYTTQEGQLVEADANAGKLLGTMVIPADTGYGQPIYFDVTRFVNKARVKAPYIAFNLRSDSGTDVFSSLEYNYG